MKKHFKVQLEEQPVATEGWSWGDWRLSAEDDFQIMINNKLVAEVPLSDLSQVTVMGKTDLNIELMRMTQQSRGMISSMKCASTSQVSAFLQLADSVSSRRRDCGMKSKS